MERSLKQRKQHLCLVTMAFIYEWQWWRGCGLHAWHICIVWSIVNPFECVGWESTCIICDWLVAWEQVMFQKKLVIVLYWWLVVVLLLSFSNFSLCLIWNKNKMYNMSIYHQKLYKKNCGRAIATECEMHIWHCSTRMIKCSCSSEREKKERYWCLLMSLKWLIRPNERLHTS